VYGEQEARPDLIPTGLPRKKELLLEKLSMSDEEVEISWNGTWARNPVIDDFLRGRGRLRLVSPSILYRGPVAFPDATRFL
jgi:hypothetical protein